MAHQRGIEVGRQEMLFECDCGWEGTESAITDWDVQQDRDRVVRQCPNCDNPIPEWGTFRPIDGVARIAKGNLQESLQDSGSEE